MSGNLGFKKKTQNILEQIEKSKGMKKSIVLICKNCDGTGKIKDTKCPICKGVGFKEFEDAFWGVQIRDKIALIMTLEEAESVKKVLDGKMKDTKYAKYRSYYDVADYLEDAIRRFKKQK